MDLFKFFDEVAEESTENEVVKANTATTTTEEHTENEVVKANTAATTTEEHTESNIVVTENSTENDTIEGDSTIDTPSETLSSKEAVIIDEKATEDDTNFSELFDKLAEVETVVPADSEDTTTPIAKKAEKKEPEFKVDIETQIRYFGTVSFITDFFTIDEIENGISSTKEQRPINQEDVRKRLEKVYPELTKKDSTINLIEKKNIIVPSMMAKKKGATPMSNIGVLLMENKIPYSILFSFIKVSNIFNELQKEVHADIYYDFDKKSYFLDIPKQIISTVNVEVIEDPLVTLDRIGVNCAKVMEIHSHHSMPAIPSSQDNQSEQVVGMIYGIVGSLEYGWPTLAIRTYQGVLQWRKIAFEQVFESPFAELPLNFKENFGKTFIKGDN